MVHSLQAGNFLQISGKPTATFIKDEWRCYKACEKLSNEQNQPIIGGL
jgi:hypothetical protein